MKLMMRDNPECEVVMTGHSLETSMAALITPLMRDEDAFTHPLLIGLYPPLCLTYDLADGQSGRYRDNRAGSCPPRLCRCVSYILRHDVLRGAPNAIQ